MRNYYIFFLFLTALVITVVIIGFNFAGSPLSQRAIRLDNKRSADFQLIESQIKNYASQNNKLPDTLSDLTGNINIIDPSTKNEYGYKILTSSKYELCTVFDTDSSKTDNYYLSLFHQLKKTKHKKGYDCLSYQLSNYYLKSTPTPTVPKRRISKKPSPYICDEHTLALWKLEDSERGKYSIKDSCGDNHGTANGTLVVEGQFGNARLLNGTGDFIDFGNKIQAASIKTIEFWVKFNTLRDGQAIVSKSSYNNGIEILLWNQALSYYVMGGSGENTSSISIPYSMLNTTDFFYVAATQDGPKSPMLLYLNGNLFTSGETPYLISDAPNLYLGRWINDGDQRYFKGIIDEVRLSDRVRTEEEIKQIYQLGI